MNLEKGVTIDIALEIDKGGTWSLGPSWTQTDATKATLTVAGDKVSATVTGLTAGHTDIRVTGTNDGTSLSAVYSIDVVSESAPSILIVRV